MLDCHDYIHEVEHTVCEDAKLGLQALAHHGHATCSAQGCLDVDPCKIHAVSILTRVHNVIVSFQSAVVSSWHC
jgi:hypothetical protein